MPATWMIRPGRRAAHADDWARLGVTTISWFTIPGLGDLRQHDEEEILDLLAGAGRKQPRADARELLAFRDDMHIDDIVVAPARSTILLGRITGDYDFVETPVVGDHRHVRTVEWFGRWWRDALPEHMAHRPRTWQRTVLELPHEQEWLDLAQRVREGDGEPVFD